MVFYRLHEKACYYLKDDNIIRLNKDIAVQKLKAMSVAAASLMMICCGLQGFMFY
jgi:hypothetical protein